MEFGAALFFTDYAISATDLAVALEERGFESLWAPEHSHIPLSRRSPFPPAATCRANTPRRWTHSSRSPPPP